MRSATVLLLALGLQGVAWAQDGWKDWGDWKGWGDWGDVKAGDPPPPRVLAPEEKARRAAYEAVQARVEAELRPALEIVDGKRPADYPRAIRHLRQIVAGKGLAEGDARAYLAWIEADLQVSLACRLFDLGEQDRALRLLDVAGKNQVLGPEARASLAERVARYRAGPVPARRPVAADEPRVMTTAGRQVPRSHALELRDPVSGRAFYLALHDPVALRRAKIWSTDPPAGGETLLDLLARGAPPEPATATPSAPAGEALRGAAGALGALGR